MRSLNQGLETLATLKLCGGFTEENQNLLEITNLDSILLSYGDWINFKKIAKSAEKIKRLTIKSYGAVALSEIKIFKNITYLKIDVPNDKVEKGILDFKEFGYLEDCWLYWNKNYINVFEVKTLKTLVLVSFKEKDLSKLSNLINLNSLEIYGGSFTSLVGVQNLSHLETLSLGNISNLHDTSSLSLIRKNLKTLSVCRCQKLIDWSFIAELPNLIKLTINNKNNNYINEIYSLSKIEELHLTNPPHLDLEKILNLPSLKVVELIEAKYFKYDGQKIKEIISGLLENIEIDIQSKGKKKYVKITIDRV